MRQIMSVVAGTVLAYSAMASAAIAQIYNNCPPTMIERSVPLGVVPMGRTQQGDWLDLHPHSLEWTRNGVRFTYALNGQPIQGLTTCNGVWTANGKQLRATSAAARRMLNYVCSDRRVTHFREANPDRSEQWAYEKAIYDLDRDRI